MTEEKNVKLSIYIPEKLRTRFKIACAAEQTSMNQALIGFIEEWTDKHDPLKKALQEQPPAPQPPVEPPPQEEQKPRGGRPRGGRPRGGIKRVTE